MVLTEKQKYQRYEVPRQLARKKANIVNMVVGDQTYVLPSIKNKKSWRHFIEFIQEWKKDPTLTNYIKLANKYNKGPNTPRYLIKVYKKWLRGQAVKEPTRKVFESIKNNFNLSPSQVSEFKGYTKSVIKAQDVAKATLAASLRTSAEKLTYDYPEIVKTFDKYKYDLNISNFKNQDAILTQLKNNPTIIKRFKAAGVPLTIKNLKTRISRTHNAVINNTLHKNRYPEIFEGISLADRQNFLNKATRLFESTVHRTFQGQLVDTLKGNELKLASDKLSKFATLKRFLVDRLNYVGGTHKLHNQLLQLDHPISLAALDKTKNLHLALRVNPIAGDINIWKANLDRRLNVLQKNKDVKGLRALNEINQALFGKGSPSFTVGAEGISQIKGLPADFRKANVIEQLKGKVGLHDTLKENIPKISKETWKTAGLNQAKITGELNALKSWKPEVLTPLIEEWTAKNPKFTKILEKRIGCQSGCLAATANESPAAFSEALKKTPAAARSFLGMLGKFGVKAAPYAAIAAAGAAIEPLVKPFRSDDPTTYLSDENQQKGMLLSMIEGETPKVDEDILKWQYPAAGAAAAAAIPGSAAMYKARRLPFKSVKRGIDRAAMGPARAALGPVGKFLAGSFSPLGVAATLPLHIAAQRKGGTEWGDIATDPGHWMGPAFASSGAKMATRGMAPTGILAKAIRMGMSPRALMLGSRFLGWPGLALTAGMWGYDKWKNRDRDD